MSCDNCKTDCKWGTIISVCRVCELNDHDTTAKFVCYCDTCEAYICEKHWGWNTPLARVEAVIKDSLEKTIEVVENFIKSKRKKKDNATDDFGKDDSA